MTAGALAPCVTALATVACGPTRRADLGRGRVVILARSAGDRDAALVRASQGARVVSRSRAAGIYAAVLAPGGRIGLDIETLARIAANATAADPWLAESERDVVRAAADPWLEIAGRWVLKEAYGKAIGVGLALPLDGIAFHGAGGRIVLAAAAVGHGWDFALYRHGEAICAVAAQAIALQATAFAPIGRNPPVPVWER